jgi:hypothetical protein
MQEIKAHNAKVIEFFRTKERLQRLIEFITVDPQTAASDAGNALAGESSINAASASADVTTASSKEQESSEVAPHSPEDTIM